MIIKKIKDNPVKFILVLFILIILLNKSFNNVSYYTGNKIGLIELRIIGTSLFIPMSDISFIVTV